MYGPIPPQRRRKPLAHTDAFTFFFLGLFFNCLFFDKNICFLHFYFYFLVWIFFDFFEIVLSFLFSFLFSFFVFVFFLFSFLFSFHFCFHFLFFENIFFLFELYFFF